LCRSIYVGWLSAAGFGLVMPSLAAVLELTRSDNEDALKQMREVL